MKTLKLFYERYSNAIFHALQPLGILGVFAMAFIDSAALGMPLDPTVGAYIWLARNDLLRVAALIFLAGAGSALGSTVIYVIGKKGGEALLHSRVPKARVIKLEAWFDRHEFLALMLPSMLPPPAPFKLFVLSAAVFQMPYLKFLGAIFAGRALRFLILAVLIIRFGPEVVDIVGGLIQNHLGLTLAISIAGVVAIVLFIMAGKRRRARRGNS